MAENHEIKFLEKCLVAPPPDAVSEFILPLTFYDLQCLLHPPCQCVQFYRFRHPTSPNFSIPTLKSSLSLVLKQFLPLAGYLICPIDSDEKMPELRYMKGDGVSLTIAETSEDFDYLVGDHQRNSYKFHSLLPQLQEPFVTMGSQLSSIFALQVTVFPNCGVSIGHTFLHVVGDIGLFMNFHKLWASMNNFTGDSLEMLQNSYQTFYDRSMVQDPFHLDRKIFNDAKLLKSYGTPRVPTPKLSEDDVRATFILHHSDSLKLKCYINGDEGRNNASTFTVICSLMWTCLSKSLEAISVVENDKLENFCAFINCRQRLEPPLHENYFGNCIVPCIVGLNHGILVGNEGLSVAAASIKDAIHKTINYKEGILREIGYGTRTPNQRSLPRKCWLLLDPHNTMYLIIIQILIGERW